MSYQVNNFWILFMSKALSMVRKTRFPHCLRLATVYLFPFLLTMGGTHPLFASQYAPLSESITADPKIHDHTYLLYRLLSAELASARHLPHIALENYLEVAQIASDPAAAEESTLLAIHLEAPNEAITSAIVWAKKAPHNLQAQLIALTLLIGQSSQKAIPYLNRALDIDPIQVSKHISDIQLRLSDNSAKNLQVILNQIALARSDNPYACLLAASSSAQLGDKNTANQWIDTALTLKPNLVQAIELKASLIQAHEKSKNLALAYIAKKVQDFPNNTELRYFYASTLADNQQIPEAKTELTLLIKDKVLGGSALLFLSELFFKENNYPETKNLLLQAQHFSDSRDGAQYLLGEVEEQQGNKSKAVHWYSSVAPGPFHVPAILRAVVLLKSIHAYPEAIYLLHNGSPATLDEQKYLLLAEIDLLNAGKNFEDALQLANEILAKLPDDIDVLYLHAVTAHKLQKWRFAEASLKKILQQDPNNANALNALGYTLSFDADRSTEALHYLTQALHISPNNPSFIDSLGWTYYRLGDFERAITYLQKAHGLSEAGEIAAHLGEALWINNHQNEALTVWKNALEKNAKNEEILSTLKRFNIDLQ